MTSKNTYFNRSEYIELLNKRSRDLKDGYRQNLAILGDGLIGKTTILHAFLRKFYDPKITVMYLEVRPEPLNEFAKRFIGVLLYNFLSNSGITLQENLSFLIEKSHKFIPKTIEKINLILSSSQKRNAGHLFTDLLSLPESIQQETGKFTVIIFDEFVNLEHIGFKNLYREWSKLLILQKKTLYIITSSQKNKAKTILAKNLSLLFGNFEIVEMTPLTASTSADFLRTLIGPEVLNEASRDFLVSFCAGSPFYLNIIAEAILKNPKKPLADILENLLFDTTGLLHQRFSNYLTRLLDTAHSKDYLIALQLIASGRNKIKDIAQIVHKQQKELHSRINKLVELDIVSKSGDFVKINDKVFGFWVRFVHQEKSQSLTFDAKKQQDQFNGRIHEMINEFTLNAGRPLVERMTELLNLFEDDTVQIDTKRIRLTHFREIKHVEFKTRRIGSGILGRSSDSLWLVAVKPETLTEDDITDFARECKKYQNKLQQRIIVTLQDIDMNTKLRALEEKIMTWDVTHLNHMFDLFSKPSVVSKT